MASKKNLIFLPGLGYTKTLWNRVVAFLPKEKYNCISLDLPTYGTAYKNTYLGFHGYTRWLDDRLSSKKVKPPYILIGHSLGGFIALNYAIANSNNINKLVMVSSPLRNPKNKYPTIYKILIWLGINSSVARKFVKDISSTGNELIYIISDRFSLAKPSFLAKSDIKSVAICIRDFLNHDWKTEALKLSVSTLFVYGLKDAAFTKTGGAEYFNIVKNKKIISFPCNHSVPTKYPRALAREIVKFIEEK